jgi:hypothetical protein
MAVTYEPIATTTLGSASATITFNSIPATYTDLRLVFFGKEVENSSITKRLRFNSDSGNNYSHVTITADPANRYTTAESGGSGMRLASQQIGDSSTYFVLITVDILSYTGSQLKTTMIEVASNDTDNTGYVQKGLGLWNDTSAITSITLLFLNSSTWQAGSTATLYGITAAS